MPTKEGYTQIVAFVPCLPSLGFFDFERRYKSEIELVMWCSIGSGLCGPCFSADFHIFQDRPAADPL